MKNLLLLSALILWFSSCKKEDDDVCPNANPATPTITPANNYVKLAVGNYWVYDDYDVDSDGVATYNPQYDSAYVSADTVWNGNTYFIWHDLFFDTWVRDSSGFIIDTAGDVKFTNQIFNMPISFTYYSGNLGYNEQMTLSTPVSVTVPAGTFSAYDWQTEAHFTLSTYPWDPVRYAHSYFSDGIGKVKQIYFYASQSSTVERRLNHYHVQ